MRWRLKQWFAPQKPVAKLPFEFLPFRYTDGKDKHQVKFAPVEFEVVTQIPGRISPNCVAMLKSRPCRRSIRPITRTGGG